ncbi:hypothetical protein ZHAS_00002608 [Anopheles sinensis]|uniref:Uncharacterized protein n=1 Tax=Anopheles sinensis TaxID=74873 RepID=A0A084VCL0_ANOSI|nr:hypothetical protein ZHAS_00002608 [Anopheles sinensis]
MEIPTIEHLSNWLANIACELRRLPKATDKKLLNVHETTKPACNPIQQNIASQNNGRPGCPNCKGNHSILNCDQFKNKTHAERYEVIKREKLCSSCLRSNGHEEGTCWFARECGISGCQERHHLMIHIATEGLNYHYIGQSPTNVHVNVHSNAEPQYRKPPPFKRRECSSKEKSLINQEDKKLNKNRTNEGRNRKRNPRSEPVKEKKHTSNTSFNNPTEKVTIPREGKQKLNVLVDNSCNVAPEGPKKDRNKVKQFMSEKKNKKQKDAANHVKRFEDFVKTCNG